MLVDEFDDELFSSSECLLQLEDEHEAMPTVTRTNSTVSLSDRSSKKIFICDDTLLEIVKCIPRKQLPNVDAVNYQFWRLCVPFLERCWPHFIGRLRITGKRDESSPTDEFAFNQMEVVQGKERKLVPIAVSEPPASILGVRVITIRDFVSRDAIQFFRSISSLITDCVLTFRDLDNFLSCKKQFVDEFFALFPKCYTIELVKASSRASKQFFARPEISLCKRLFIWDAQQDFQLTSVFDWLHNTTKVKQRWLLLDARFSPTEVVSDFLEKIKRKFDDDDSKCSFVVQIYPPDRLPVFLHERLKTEEMLILYRVPNKLSYRLKRCPRNEAPEDVIEFVQDATPQIPYFPFFLKAMSDRNRSKVYVGPIHGYEEAV